ncbi:glycosyltransferase [Sphingomonas cannabina]|uniref:glycosyltransferase n=1 Tax=Sphingomonas cannabina TaxID=2899123 RepID=UPI001F3FF93E|nr:glycosyltransferase [Sphingomonas cannabina]UIJ46221.1 glycosyltransferase [Sphingomonas cannabina]
MADPGQSYRFPPNVVRTVDQEDIGSYRAAAAAITRSGADLLWVQHEFGIFGGPAGIYLLELLNRLALPVVVTLHTVLEDPNADQFAVMERLLKHAQLLIVMAQRARTILEERYGVASERIAVIPHGVPDRPYVTPALARARLGLEDRKTVLTFGLLSPGKGIETMIRAMPVILARCPDTLYSIVGATHPHLVAHEGEAYRARLQSLAHELGVGGHIRWEARFLDEEALIDRIAAADVYVTPYGNPAQITSGTLAYAFGLGKPIVSTPYVHAVELLADGRGRLVDFGDVAGFARTVGALLANDAGRARMAARAYEHGRSMTWARMVERAVDAFADMLAEEAETTQGIEERVPAVLAA